MDFDGLKKYNNNIIKWYPFEENKKILQIGINSSITETLKNICKSVKVIDSICEIKNDIYDYILIYGYEKFQDIIKKIKDLLSDDGKILIIGNNTLGIYILKTIIPAK